MPDSQVAQVLALFVVAGGGQHVGAQTGRDRDRGQAGSAGRAVDQDSFSGGEPADVAQGVPGREEGGGEPCRGDGVDPGRDRRHGCGGHGGERGEGAATQVGGEHGVPDADVLDAGSDGGDRAGAFEADAVPGVLVGGQQAHAGEDIAEVHAGGPDPQFHLARSRGASRGGEEFQGVEVAEAAGSQLDPVGAVADGARDGCRAFAVRQRGVGEAGDVAGGATKGDLVLGRPCEEFTCDAGQVGVGRTGVHEGGPQLGVFVRQDPDEAAQGALGRVRRLAGVEGLGGACDGVQAGGLGTGGGGLGDGEQPSGAAERGRAGVLSGRERCAEQHHASRWYERGGPASGEGRSEPFEGSVGDGGVQDVGGRSHGAQGVGEDPGGAVRLADDEPVPRSGRCRRLLTGKGLPGGFEEPPVDA